MSVIHSIISIFTNKYSLMKIYTSYFAQVAKLRNAGIVPIGIALYPPKYYHGSHIQWLAPKSFMLSGLTDEDYEKKYRELILDNINLRLLESTLMQMGEGRDVALCCYEKPGDFCHRHIFAKWFEEKTGIKIEEFGTAMAQHPRPVQSSMF